MCGAMPVATGSNQRLGNKLYTGDATSHTMERKMAAGLEDRILGLLEHGPATPNEVASQLGIAWATAQGRLLRLVGTGTVSASRKGRINVYFLKAPRRIRLDVPSWGRVRSLEQLSEELRAYFPPNVSAAEMIRKERRTA